MPRPPQPGQPRKIYTRPPVRIHWCRLPTCNSSSDVNPELKFYSFPMLGDTQLKWLEAVGVPEWRSQPWEVLKPLQLCSLHFDETCFSEFGHLYPTAVPSLHLFPCTDDSSSEEESVPCPPIKTTPKPDTNNPRCDNCGYLMFSGNIELPDTWRQESKGIQIMRHPADSDPLASLPSLKKEVVKLDIPGLLNSVLKLPSPNRLTKDIRICVNCVSVLSKILALFNLLKKMSTANSVLSTVFTELEEILHLLVLDNRASQLQLERLRKQKEAGDKKLDSLTNSAPVVQPPGTASAFPELEAPVIIKSESISVTPGFIQPREDEPMEEDPLANTPPAAPLLLPTKKTPLSATQKTALSATKKTASSATKKKLKTLAWHFTRLDKKQLYFKKLEEERKEQERKAEEERRKLEEENSKWTNPRNPGEPRRRRRKKPNLFVHPPCPHCGLLLKPSLDKHGLDRHISVRHTLCSKFTCDICARPCRSPKDLRKHKLTHMNEEERSQSGSQSLLCPECGKMLRSEVCLKQHLKTHEDVESRLLRCPEENCDYATLTPSKLKQHARLHDPTAETPFKCTKCGAGFKFNLHLKYHVMKDCAPPDRVHACDLPGCGKRFKLKQGLVLHYVSGFHGLSAEEAREKVYPGLPCPDWVEAQINKTPKRKHYYK